MPPGRRGLRALRLRACVRGGSSPALSAARPAPQAAGFGAFSSPRFLRALVWALGLKAARPDHHHVGHALSSCRGREGGMPVCTRLQPGQALSWRPRSVPFLGERPRPRAERSVPDECEWGREEASVCLPSPGRGRSRSGLDLQPGDQGIGLGAGQPTALCVLPSVAWFEGGAIHPGGRPPWPECGGQPGARREIQVPKSWRFGRVTSSSLPGICSSFSKGCQPRTCFRGTLDPRALSGQGVGRCISYEIGLC